jgi:hypothetical protein
MDVGASSVGDCQGLYGGGGGMLSRGVSTPLGPLPITENVSIPSQSSMRRRRCISSMGEWYCSRLQAVAHTAATPEKPVQIIIMYNLFPHGSLISRRNIYPYNFHVMFIRYVIFPFSSRRQIL